MLTRDQFQELYDQGPDALFAVYEQQHATLQTLQEIVNALTAQVQELKARLDKDSHNSSKPPSSDGYAKKPAPQSLRSKTGRKPGGQPGHRGCTLELSDTPDQILSHLPTTCARCQQPLTIQQSVSFESHQVHDLPPLRLVVTEHRALTCRCACGHTTTAPFPTEAAQPVQYGPRVLALGLLLREYHLLPMARTAQLLQQGFGASISVGTLSQALRRADRAVRPVTAGIVEAIRKAKRVHFDETGMRVAGSLHWLHSASTPTLTHYRVHAKRGQAAIEAANILPGFTGTAVHDGWCSYAAYACQHALCNAHHLRELTGLCEQGHSWAGAFKTLLTDMYQAVQQAKSVGKSCVHFQHQCRFEKRYQALLEQGYAANPPPAKPPRDHRGRVKQSAARNLLCRLDQHRQWVLAFLYDFDIPFDNNLAERDLRMMKLRQKVSGGFRTLTGAEAFGRLRGYLSTLRKQGMALLPALEQLLAGTPIYPAGVTP